MKRILLTLTLFLASAPALAQQQVIATGSSPNNGTGDTPRVAFTKTNANFSALFAAVNALQSPANASQPLSPVLSGLAATTPNVDQVLYAVGSNAFSTTAFPAFGRSLVAAPSSIAARSTLGLGGAALLSVGTTTGTVAAGDDARVLGAAQKANNLSDLSNFPVARTNLGLGNAATRNVGTASGTVAAGDDSRIVGALTSAAAAATYAPIGSGLAGQITGFLPVAFPSGSSITISAGSAADSTNAVPIKSGSASWAASNGNAANGYQGGTSLPASSTVHFFEMQGSAGTASFASASLSPTLPSGYAYFRRIFSLRTDGSGNLVGGIPVEVGGGAITFWLTTPTLDFGVGVGTSVRTMVPLNVPTGIKVQPLYRMNVNASNNSSAVLITSGDETDLSLPQGGNTPWTVAPGLDIDTTPAVLNIGGSSGQNGMLTTDTSGQIGLRAFSGQVPNVYWVTRGFVDFRRN